MPAPNKTLPARKALYAKLPTKSYQKLRRLARLPAAPDTGTARKAVLVRVAPELFRKLWRLALARSSSSGRSVGMQSVLAQLIDDAKMPVKRERSTMARVVSDLLRKARTPKRNGAA